MNLAMNDYTTETKTSILIVEDDVRLAALMQEYLTQSGMRVEIETRGDRACQRILEQPPDLVVLDLMLPGQDGFSICRSLRPQFTRPILMLTARDDDIDQVVGLEMGADDYVTKPIQPRVLLARIQALLRRCPTSTASLQQDHPDSLEVVFDAFRISVSTREVYLQGKLLDFTTNEFELLWLLARNAGRVVSRDQILAELRGIGYDGVDRSVDVGISRLRRKLGDDPEHPFRIKTVRGKGYLLAREAWK